MDIILMKRPVLHQLASLCIAISVFFSVATVAHADQLTLPQQYAYPGLTFSAPLTYTTTTKLPQQTTSIAFTSQDKLILSTTKTNKPTESILLTPTITNQKPPIKTLQPTPTIFLKPIQSPPASTATPTPSTQPTEAASSSEAVSYTPTPQTNTGGLNASDLFSRVNAYRASQGLPAFQEDAKTCSLAQERAPEVAGEVATGTMHSGLTAMHLSYWNTENIIQMNSDQAAFNWWINDPIHHEAIVGNFKYSCVACSGNSCAEEFTNYQLK